MNSPVAASTVTVPAQLGVIPLYPLMSDLDWFGARQRLPHRLLTHARRRTAHVLPIVAIFILLPRQNVGGTAQDALKG